MSSITKNSPMFYNVIPWFLFCLELCWGQSSIYYLDRYPIRDRKTIQLQYNSYSSGSWDSTLILKSSSKTYPFEGEYAVTVLFPNNVLETYRIFGTVESFHIRNNDRLKITSTTENVKTTIYDSKYSGTISKTFYVGGSGNAFKKALVFELKLSGFEKFEGLEITLTAARHCSSSYSSRYYEFYCSNSYCIKDDLKCNGKNNCGNNDDETSFYCSRGSVIGYSIGGILLFIALIIGCVILCRRRNNRPTTLGTNTVVIPTQSNIYPGHQVPVANPVPPGTYLYNTNQNWQQFPYHNGTEFNRMPPPPPYPGLNTTYSQNQPSANLPFQSLSSTYPQNQTGERLPYPQNQPRPSENPIHSQNQTGENLPYPQNEPRLVENQPRTNLPYPNQPKY